MACPDEPAAPHAHVSLSAMAHGGSAVGRDTGGRVVFVDGGLPLESVEVRLVEERPRLARGVLASLPRRASPDRIERPACPHFGRWPERGDRPAEACGGCQWQHARYPAQLTYKQHLVRDALQRIGRLPDPSVAETLGMDDPWRYRNRLTLRAGHGALALVAADGRSHIPISDCPVSHELLADLLATIQVPDDADLEVVLRAGLRTGDRMIVLRDPGGQVDDVEIDTTASVILSGPRGTQVAAGRPFLVERLGGRAFLVPPEAFFQVNTGMAEALVGLVRDAVPAGTGLLVDAFSGVGTFALLTADLADEVVAIEVDPAAVAAAIENATSVDNLTLIEGTAAEGLEHLSATPDTLIVDPPRAGLPRAVHRYLAARRPPTIIYVSCEPTTLARDAGHLAAHGYRLASCQPVDMFPQTCHIETICVFARPGGPREATSPR